MPYRPALLMKKQTRHFHYCKYSFQLTILTLKTSPSNLKLVLIDCDSVTLWHHFAFSVDRKKKYMSHCTWLGHAVDLKDWKGEVIVH